MQTFNFKYVAMNKEKYPDYEYYGKGNLLPTKYYKRKCSHCGYEMNFYVHKKKLCRVCNNYIYPDDEEEFRAILKEKIKEKENKDNGRRN